MPDGAATTDTVALPVTDTPAALVAMHVSDNVPAASALKEIVEVVEPAVTVPLLMVHA